MDGVKWRTPHLFKADAGVVLDEITRLADGKETKDVKPQEIVKYAEQNPDSELHKCFEWNNDVAANNWRVQQARSIVCNIVVTQDNEKKPDEPYNIRIIQQSAETKAYKPISLMNASEYEKSVKEAWDYFRKGKEKYKFLKDSGLQAIMDMID